MWVSKWTSPMGPCTEASASASGWVIEWSPPSSTGITPAEATSATSAVMAACDDSGSAGTQAASP